MPADVDGHMDTEWPVTSVAIMDGMAELQALDKPATIKTLLTTSLTGSTRSMKCTVAFI